MILDQPLKIAAIRIVHHYTQLPSLCFIDLPELNNVGMSKGLEYLGFL